MSDTPENVYEAVNYVMKQVGYVQKEESRKLGYSYASEAALISAIRPHMVEVGLFVYPSSMIDIPAESFTSKHGSTINVSKLAAIYCFHHAPSDTKFFVSVIGKGMDTGDKDSNKAMTAAFKYAIRQPLMIETGDDPDKISSEEFEKTDVSFARPLSPEALKIGLNKRSEEMKAQGMTRIAQTKRGLMVGVLNRIFAGPNADADRHILLSGIFGEESSKKLKAYQVLAVLKWLNTEQDSGGQYIPDQMSATEAVAFVDHLIEEGEYEQPQPELMEKNNEKP